MWSISRKLAFILLFLPLAFGQNPVSLDTGVKGSRMPSFGCTESDSSNAYVITTCAVLSPGLRNGSTFSFFATNANTASSSLDVDSTGAKTIKKLSSGSFVTLTSGDISAGGFVVVSYDLLNDIYQCLTCGGGSAGSSVSVNGTTVASPNFNDTTPAAASNNVNVTWQQSSGNVSAQVSAATSSVLGVVKGGTCTNQFLRGHTSGTGAQVCASVANTDLANSSTTVNSQTCTLGSSCTIPLVSSFSGDGSLLSNSASTGSVTATLANAAAHKWWGNNTGSTAAPGYQSIGTGDLPGSGATTVNGITCLLGGTCTVGGAGLSGTNVQTGNYTLTSSDNAKLVIMNCSSACTATLYASPSSVYFTEIISIGAIQAAVSLNSKTYNGASTAPTLNNQIPLLLWSDGTNYYGNPIGAPTDLQARRGAHGTFVTCAQSNNVASGSERIYCLTSYDGINWTQFGPAPISSTGERDPALIHHDGLWWIAATSGASNSWDLYTSPDLITWTGPTAVSVSGVAGVTNAWAPHWFVDNDGTVRVYIALSTDSGSTFNIYEMHPTARDMSTWSTPSNLTASGFAAKNIDPCVVRVGLTYYMFFKDDTTGFGHTGPIDLATSTSPTSGWTVTQTGNWAGWQTGLSVSRIEAPQIVQMDDGRFRIYFVNNNNLDSLNVYYSETTDSTFATGWSSATAISSLSAYNHPVPNRYPGAEEFLDSSGFIYDVRLPTKVSGSSCGDATHSCSLTYDSKGRIVLGSNNTISGSGLGDYALLSSTSTTGSQSSVTFSSISSSYTDLKVVIRGRGTQAVTNLNVLAQFNSDTTGTYQYEDVHWFSTAGAASQSTAQTSMIVGLIPGSSATANYSGTIEMTIGAYTGTTFYKQTVSHCGVTLGTGTFSVGACLYSGAWASTSAINAVKIFVGSGGFVDGTVISLYGVK